MLVSHLHRFIYIKTFKVAGTSIESYFEKFCMRPGEWQQMHYRDEYESSAGIIGDRHGQESMLGHKWWNHMSAASVKAQLPSVQWDNYFKFCAVRNPWEKVISGFYWEKYSSNKPILDLASERLEFAAWITARMASITDFCLYTIDDKFCLDDVIRYESLHEDMARICAKIGVPWKPELLPEFKIGSRPENMQASDLYTDDTIQLVAKLYSNEIETFKYTLHNL